MFDVLGIKQQAFNDFGELFSRIRESEQALAFANEKFNAKLVFKILDVFANAGLRCEKCVADQIGRASCRERVCSTV